MNTAEFQEISCDAALLAGGWLHDQDNTVWLDSAKHNTLHRYSYIGVMPFKVLRLRGDCLFDNDCLIKADPLVYCQQLLQQYVLQTHPNLPPFQGGMMGYFGYEFAKKIECLPELPDIKAIDDFILGFYDVVIAIDHLCNRAWIFSSGYPEQHDNQRKRRAQHRIEQVKALIATRQNFTASTLSIKTCTDTLEPPILSSNFSESRYLKAVNTVQQAITNGDIFEANIAQRFQASLDFQPNAWELYHQLRQFDPNQYAAMLRFDKLAILSNSPELFLTLNNQQVMTAPIKGTIVRSDDLHIDQKLRDQLRHSDKDRAENIMIVDLMRNDLSKVCQPHSVRVPQLCQLQTLPNLHHLVSTVTGTLQTNYGPFDLLGATFPAGSITGAPKIRAMQIIAEIEGCARGPYCGSIGAIGFDGSMQLNVAIRTLIIHQHELSFYAGGAVTLASDPQQEYQESCLKASRLKAFVQQTCLQPQPSIMLEQ